MSEKEVRPRDVAEWAANAIADAEQRGLRDLRPLLENLAQSLAILRAADWNADSSGGRENKTDVRKGA